MRSLSEAIIAATQAHAGQVDKAGQPYILHPLRVMLAMPDDEDLRMAAVLHDVLEDCPAFDILSIPVSIRWLVRDLTCDVDQSYQSYIQRVGMDPRARIIKLADLADNLDRSRIASPTKRDLARWAKYERAAAWLAGPRTERFALTTKGGQDHDD